MIENWLFIFALLAVLLVPGPTNALLASIAQQQGIAKTFQLVPVQLLGYIYGISLWALFIHLTLPTWPLLIEILHFFSVIYMLWLALHLWKSSDLEKHSQNHKTLKSKQLFISTLKNPKCILFAAGIFPVWTWDSIENYAIVMLVFSLCLIPSAFFWMCFGRSALLGKVKGLSTDQFYKASAMLLMICMLPMLWHFF